VVKRTFLFVVVITIFVVVIVLF